MVRCAAYWTLIFVAAGAVAQGPASKPAVAPPPATAEAASAELRALVEARKFADAWKLAAPVRALLRAPNVAAPLKRDVETLLLKAGIESVGVAAGFAGAASAPMPGLIEVAYDATLPGWEEDFEFAFPIPTPNFAKLDKRVLRNTGAFCHRAYWSDDVTIEAEGIARAEKDYGPIFIDPDEVETERFLVGFHHNAYFGVKYDEGRSISKGHILLLAGRGAESKARARPTQLFAQSAAPAVALGDPVRCALKLKGARLEFTTGTDPKTAAKLAFTLASGSQTFKRVHPGLLVRDSAFEISRLTLRGKLDAKWASEERERLDARIAGR